MTENPHISKQKFKRSAASPIELTSRQDDKNDSQLHPIKRPCSLKSDDHTSNQHSCFINLEHKLNNLDTSNYSKSNQHACNTDDNSSTNHKDASRGASTEIESDTELFENNPQNTILNLARAVTSTLMIEIYHKCFGKCNGFYYPSLLKNSSSQCIECTHCHKLMDPQSFITHTHGIKEINVFHWGFDPTQWRHYICLSKRQLMNNLDDDELLNKFEQLKSGQGVEDYDDSIKEKINHENFIHLASAKSSQFDKKISLFDLSDIDSYRNHMTRNSDLKAMTKPNHTTKTNGIISNHHLTTATTANIPPEGYPNNRKMLINQRVMPSMLPQASPIDYSQAFSIEAMLKKNDIDSLCLSQVIHNAKIKDFAPGFEKPSASMDPLSFEQIAHLVTVSNPFATPNLNQSTKSLSTPINIPIHNNKYYGSALASPGHTPNNYPSTSSAPMLQYPKDITNPHTSQENFYSSQTNKNQLHQDLRRDSFVSSHLATYLTSKGIDADTSRDIVKYTLDLISKSSDIL